MIFEENMINLFDKADLTTPELIDILRDKFLLEKDEAVLFADFIMSNSYKENRRTVVSKLSSVEIVRRIVEFAGDYQQLNSDKLSKQKEEVKKNFNNDEKEKLISKLKLLNGSSFIYVYDFMKIVSQSEIFTNIEAVSTILLRKSCSLLKITREVIKSEIIEFLETLKPQLENTKRNSKKISK